MLNEKLTAEILYAVCSVYSDEVNMMELVECPNTSRLYMNIDKAMATGFNKILEMAKDMKSGWIEFTNKSISSLTENDLDPIIFAVEFDDGIITNVLTCSEIPSE